MKNVWLAVFLFMACPFEGSGQGEKEFLYVGTYSIRESKGIYVFEINRSKGAATLVQTINDLPSPTFLEIHPTGNFLYSVNRGSINGDQSGSVSAFKINRKTGKLTLINHVSSYGKDPCHISIDNTGRWVFISNYNEGNLVVMPVFEDGSLGAVSDSKKYSGRGVNKFRQEQPHIHSAEVSADNRFLYVSDLGTDKIYTYTIDAKNGRISPAQKFETTVTPGAGPRHFALHPGGTFAYSAEELSSTVGIFKVDRTTGELSLLRDTLSSLPPNSTVINTSAHIDTDPKGKYLYVSNRGEDAIAVFTINPDGTLLFKGQQKTSGKSPRHFFIDQKGKFLWVANQNTDNIIVYRLNAKTGMPVTTGIKLKVPSPVCIRQLIAR